MELLKLVAVIKRRWWIIIIPVIIAFALTLPVMGQLVNPPVQYEVRVRLTAAAPPGAESTVTDTPYEDAVYVPWLASEYVAVNLPHWIVSDSFAAEVSAVLSERGLELSTRDLKGVFRADSYRSIITLFVSWEDQDAIEAITQAAITVLQERNQSYFPQFAAEPAHVVPLDDVEVIQVAAPLAQRIDPLVRLLLGAIAGAGLAMVAETVDRSLYTREDVEILGFDVLGEIPRE